MLRDIILLIVVFGSAGGAVMFPWTGTDFQPFVMYFMMMLLFLGFTRIDFRQLLDTSRTTLLRLAILASTKLIFLPVALFGATYWLSRDYAIPVLLLSGISTGVVAPFMAALVAADAATVVRMVVVTSVLVPVSLPCLVKILAGAEISIPLWLMMKTLCFVIFAPLFAVVFMRRYLPSIIDGINKMHFPLSLCLFAAINLGVFSKYSSFFFDRSTDVIIVLFVSYALAAIYCATGFLMFPGAPRQQRVAASISLALMNNVLVVVFSSQFFEPLSPTLAAMYLFPFFSLVTPLRLMGRSSAPLAERQGAA
jgi:BASS family bile acid:Na+ symporter